MVVQEAKYAMDIAKISWYLGPGRVGHWQWVASSSSMGRLYCEFEIYKG
jgi:hypothetical protein